MDIKKLLLSSLAGTVAFVISGFLVYGLLLSGFMESHTDMTIVKDPPNWIAFVLANFVWSVTLAYIFLRWAGITTWKAGASAGALLGFLLSLSIDLSLYSMTTMSDLTWTLVDPIASAILCAVGGAAIAFVLGMGKTA